jgi:hypothetical protein
MVLHGLGDNIHDPTVNPFVPIAASSSTAFIVYLLPFTVCSFLLFYIVFALLFILYTWLQHGVSELDACPSPPWRWTSEELLPILQALEESKLAFPIMLSNEGTVWKDLDGQLLHDLDSRNIKLINDTQAEPGKTPQADFQALGWWVLTPTSSNANNSPKFQPTPLCH